MYLFLLLSYVTTKTKSEKKKNNTILKDGGSFKWEAFCVYNLRVHWLFLFYAPSLGLSIAGLDISSLRK